MVLCLDLEVVTPLPKIDFFHQYCRAMYGSQLWLLTSQSISNMCTQWRKAHRQVLSTPYRTHCDIIPLIAGNVPIECFLDCKFLSFYKSIASSENKTVRYVTNINSYDPKSMLGKNILHLIHKYDVSVEDILTSSKKMIKANCFQKMVQRSQQSICNPCSTCKGIDRC